MEEKIIYVYADFLSFQKELIGRLYVSQTRGNEFCSFEYDADWLQKEGTVVGSCLRCMM